MNTASYTLRFFERRQRAWLVVVIFLAVFPALNLMAFFAVYRELTFMTVPTDPYQALILYYAGDTADGYTPPLYMLMRPLSACLLIPLYHWLPNIPLRLLPADTDVMFMRASAALAAGSIISTTVTSYLVFINSLKHGRSPAVATVAALLVLPLMQFVHVFGVDALAVAVITLILALKEKVVLQCLVVCLSTAVNEKILIVIALLFGVRVMHALVAHRTLDRREVGVFATALLSFFAYLIATAVVSAQVDVHMTAAQFVPRQYIAHLVKAMSLAVTMKGGVQILFPLLVSVILFYMATLVRGGLKPIEVIVPIGLFLIASISGVDWNIGRITFLAFTVPLPFAADWIVTQAANDPRVGPDSGVHE